MREPRTASPRSSLVRRPQASRFAGRRNRRVSCQAANAGCRAKSLAVGGGRPAARREVFLIGGVRSLRRRDRTIDICYLDSGHARMRSPPAVRVEQRAAFATYAAGAKRCVARLSNFRRPRSVSSLLLKMYDGDRLRKAVTRRGCLRGQQKDPRDGGQDRRAYGNP